MTTEVGSEGAWVLALELETGATSEGRGRPLEAGRAAPPERQPCPRRGLSPVTPGF